MGFANILSISALLLSACQSTHSNVAVLGVNAEPQVSKSLNPEPVGAIYKIEEWTFESKLANCRHRWAASIPKEAPQTFEIDVQEINLDQESQTCFGTATERMSVFKALLKNALAHYSQQQLTSIVLGHGKFVDHKDRMKNAASQSVIWQDFLEKRKETPFLNGNGEFVQVFNSAHVGQEWEDLFREQGLKLELSRVEKVFMEDKLPYQAGIYVFSVSKR